MKKRSVVGEREKENGGKENERKICRTLRPHSAENHVDGMVTLQKKKTLDYVYSRTLVVTGG